MENPDVLPEVNLFISASYGKESVIYDALESEMILPEAEVPEAEMTMLVESAPAEIKPSSAITTADEPSPVRSEVAPPQTYDVKTLLVASDDHPSALPPSPATRGEAALFPEDIRPVEKTLEFLPGDDIFISLDKEGWIFDREDSSEGINLKERQFESGTTRFVFTSERGGPLKLRFVLQNSESGEDEKIIYRLESSEEVVDPDLPVVINASPENYFEMDLQGKTENGLSEAVSEENVPGVVASIDQLINPDADPGTELMLDTFALLEKQGGYDQLLVRLAENAFLLYPYDNNSAEMLFRAAQSLESPGLEQDIEKAIDLFRLVRDYFPLSPYSDRSQERISYLERHFMKIY
ncbi:MAG: hypothetical protein JXR86_18725 [Spirochaetales bacterium]|nr:hypothetical protein [Spirochaetales bacterium]